MSIVMKHVCVVVSNDIYLFNISVTRGQIFKRGVEIFQLRQWYMNPRRYRMFNKSSFCDIFQAFYLSNMA